ncbi:bile acid:sodium symporter [Thiotrichales bacterium 19X7-9]|nr:bile acid:sodium symporter [Thiotrichales bacterium 19X7-9]
MTRIYAFLIMAIVSYFLGSIYINLSSIFSNYLHQMMIGLSFLIGFTSSLDQFREIFIKNKKLIIVFFICKLIISPLVGFGIYLLFGKNISLVGLIVIGIVPSAMISVAFSRIYGGNYLLNIVSTLLMILVTPISIPILSKIYLGQFIDFNSFHIIISTFSLVVLPIILYILTMYMISSILLNFFTFNERNKIAFKHEMSLSDAALAIILSRDVLNQDTIIPVEIAVLQILVLITLNFINILKRSLKPAFILGYKT